MEKSTERKCLNFISICYEMVQKIVGWKKKENQRYLHYIVFYMHWSVILRFIDSQFEYIIPVSVNLGCS